MDRDHIELSVPARKEFARTIRMTAAALASRMGMSVDEVDDIKIAVEESYLFGSAHMNEDDPVVYAFDIFDDRLEVVVGPLHRHAEQAEEDETVTRYARFILESVCDGFELRDDGDACFVLFTKRKA